MTTNKKEIINESSPRDEEITYIIKQHLKEDIAAKVTEIELTLMAIENGGDSLAGTDILSKEDVDLYTAQLKGMLGVYNHKDFEKDYINLAKEAYNELSDHQVNFIYDHLKAIEKAEEIQDKVTDIFAKYLDEKLKDIGISTI